MRIGIIGADGLGAGATPDARDTERPGMLPAGPAHAQRPGARIGAALRREHAA